MSRTRGFTLLEILVAMVLLSILVTLMVEVLVPTLRASAKGAARVELQQMAIISLDKMMADLSRTPPSGVSLTPPDPTRMAVSMHRVAQLTAVGDQVFETQLTIYAWQQTSGTLVTKIWPPGPPAPSSPITTGGIPRLPSDLLFSIGSSLNGQERTLATGVTECSLVSASPTGLVQPLKVRIAVQGTGESYQLERTLVLHNSN